MENNLFLEGEGGGGGTGGRVVCGGLHVLFLFPTDMYIQVEEGRRERK